MNTIDEYEVIEKIGEGGMATVYKGFQTSLNRPVAIKVLSEKLSEHPEIVEHFDRESLIIARLTHPNIIHVIARGITSEGMPYFVMDFVEGSDLAMAIREGVYNTNQKLDVIIQVCKALSYAHKNGVVHRDIKPANVLIDSEGNAMVSDFGIAQFFDSKAEGDALARGCTIIGTPTYMSPEQKASPAAVTASSDVYSLGVLMYELFTGSKPIDSFEAPSEINPHIPDRLERVILKCLEPDPSDRFTSTDQIKDILLELLQGAHIQDTQKEDAIRGIAKMEDIFTLLDVIKEHRFGAVYLFRHKNTGQLMVVKKHRDTSGGFEEAKALATLKHKNIVNIHGVSGDKKLFIVVMEYISGGSLKDRLVRPHSWVQVLKTARDICDGLSFAHRNNIIHGNLRPSNILISSSGIAKIADFGLSEHYASGVGETNWYNIYGRPKSYGTDIYAAGVIFYEMLVGSVPAWGEDGFLPRKEFASLPGGVRSMVSKMLSREPENRYGRFDEVLGLINDMLSAYENEPTQLVEEEKDASPKGQTSDFDGLINRPSRPLLVLALLFAVAIAYLFFTGKASFYVEAIRQLW